MPKILTLPPAGPLSGDEAVVLVQDGETRRAPIGDAIFDRFYRIGFGITTTPTASEVLQLHVAPVPFTIPANFGAPAPAFGEAEFHPTASFPIDVKQNGTTIGTITIGTGGAFTFATVGGTAKAVAAGDVLKFTGPGVADATCANVAITIQGVY